MPDNETTEHDAPPNVAPIQDPEINAMAAAYYAIRSQPREAWARMAEWVDDRIAADLET